MGKKVLLADDSATIQKLVEMALSDTDYELMAVSDGKQAVDQLPVFQPDIVLADAIMPQMDGYEVSEHVKGNPKFQHIPVILLTGRFQPFDSDRASAAQIDERVVKPFSQDQLVTTINRLVAESSQSDPVQEASVQAETDDLDVPDLSSFEEMPAAYEEDFDDSAFNDDTVHIDQPQESDDAIPTLTENDTVAYSPDMLAAMAKGPEGEDNDLTVSAPDISAFDDDDDDGDEPMMLDDADDAEPMDLEEDSLEEIEPMELEDADDAPEFDTEEDPAGEPMAADDLDEDDEIDDVTMELTTEDLADIEPLDDEDEDPLSASFEDDAASDSSDIELGAETLPASLMDESADSPGEESIDTLPEELPEDTFEPLPEELPEELPEPFEEPASANDHDLIDTVNLDEEEDDSLSEEDFRMSLEGDDEEEATEVDAIQAPMDDLGVEEIDQPLLADELESVEQLPEEDESSAEVLLEDDFEPLPDSADEEDAQLSEEDNVLETGDLAVPLSAAQIDGLDDTLENEPVTLPSEMSDHSDDLVDLDEEPLSFDEEPVSEMPTEELDAPILGELEEDLADEPVEELGDSLIEEEPEVVAAPPAEPAPPEPEPEPEPVAASEPSPEALQPAPVEASAPPVSPSSLSPEQLDQLADKVAERLVEKLGQTSIKEIVWDVVPELAEAMIKKRIYQLEQSVDDE